MPENTPTAEEVMKAHQFLYYVLCQPVITDREYDQFCRVNNLEGGGGSDRAADYTPEIAALARKLSSH